MKIANLVITGYVYGKYLGKYLRLYELVLYKKKSNKQTFHYFDYLSILFINELKLFFDIILKLQIYNLTIKSLQSFRKLSYVHMSL